MMDGTFFYFFCGGGSVSMTTRYGGKATGFYKPCFERKKRVENLTSIHLVGFYWVGSGELVGM